MLSTILATAAVVAAAPSTLPTVASGVVVDAATGQPVSGALVQQEGSVTSAFTKPDGSFRLLLDRSGAASLTVSGVGFESQTLPVGNGKDLKVSLATVGGFVPSAPNTPLVPMGQSSADTAPLNTGLIFGYRLRREVTEQGGASISGLANNDFRLAARYRMRPWLLEAEGSHAQTPVDLPSLPRESSPAFSPSTWQVGARGSYIFPLSKDLETAAGLGYRWSNTVPNNGDIRYTGSGIDTEQTRHAVGVVGTAAWRPNRGPWHFEGTLGLYPLVFGSAKAPGTPFANTFRSDVRGVVGYELTPGLRLGVGGQWDQWVGNGGSVGAQIVSLQLHYTPGGLPRGNE
jgi:hypothetical protein